ncbi:MAG: hypothetical protein M3R54_10915 [Chloroflexota bacterium]|nr:hypothetical protein [Chloroflexota bacterium]
MSMRGRAALFPIAAALIAACSGEAAPSPTRSALVTSPGARTSPTATSRGLDAPLAARAILKRHWFTLPDQFSAEPAAIVAEFDADPSPGTPVARLRPSGREAPLVTPVSLNAFGANIDLHGLTPGTYAIEIVEHLRSGGEAIVATAEILVSQPEYVVWTLDFEGDAASDAALAATAAIADGLHVPMTVMWNPRVWTTTDVAPARSSTMQAWTMSRAAKGDEVALHLHAWADFVRASGVTPRTAPNWSGRSDGYDVPLTAFDERETRALIDTALALMADHGMPLPSTFRAGGLFANAANLRAVAAAGFTVDTSATPAGGFGRLVLPWTLARDAQPYRPSRDDANKPGDLPLLEVPNIAGNTFALDARTIRSVIAADLAMLAPAGQVATERRALTLVSHPGTIDATERAAIEALFDALLPYRYDKDSGPLRFVTAAQLARAYAN